MCAVDLPEAEETPPPGPDRWRACGRRARRGRGAPARRPPTLAPAEKRIPAKSAAERPCPPPLYTNPPYKTDSRRKMRRQPARPPARPTPKITASCTPARAQAQASRLRPCPVQRCARGRLHPRPPRRALGSDPTRRRCTWRSPRCLAAVETAAGKGAGGRTRSPAGRCRSSFSAARSRASPSPGRHCHSTLPLTVMACHCLGIYTIILLPLLTFAAKMTVSPPGLYRLATLSLCFWNISSDRSSAGLRLGAICNRTRGTPG